ncbi:hypothetical protein J4E82_011407 [Alternaria postmessia]|uniref:uncharacterized protein n=1 Tax=Alternaria postmessia TaxID=1187938 RepID=UPI0022241ED2|nr:uncharacterized protein J4E82_011407 [Alternaria postmessia]KAI5364478.1 hypothetical protein J4E82_011407 [Alternaria postmessia]
MAFTEFVIPTLKTDPATEAVFTNKIGPFLVEILDKHATPPKHKYFGKILLENGNDVSGDFRLAVGLEWKDASHFQSFVDSEDFEVTFKSLVIPHSIAPPVPQLYNTDSEPTKVFGSTLTEVWQVKIGEGSEKVAESREAWKKFVTAVAEASGSNGTEESIQGPSVNLEEKRWVGVLGWESMETREKVLGNAAVQEAKRGLDGLVSNTFVTAFQKFYDIRKEIVVAGDGGLNFTSITDIFFRTAKVIAGSGKYWSGKTVHICQRKAWTLQDIAKIVSKVKGQNVQVKVVSRKEFDDYYIGRGIDRGQVEWWSSAYDGIKNGECDIDDPTLEEFLKEAGRRPEPLEPTIEKMLS